MLVSGQGEKLLERNELPGYNLRQHSMIVFMSISLSVCTVLCVSLSLLSACVYICVCMYVCIYVCGINYELHGFLKVICSCTR